MRISTERNQVCFREASAEACASSWYGIKDYAAFKKERAATIRAFRLADCNLTALGENQCLRGLEFYATTEITRFRSAGIKSAIWEVLKQQEKLRQLGQKDEKGTLAMISLLHSNKAASFASSMALIDARCR